MSLYRSNIHSGRYRQKLQSPLLHTRLRLVIPIFTFMLLWLEVNSYKFMTSTNMRRGVKDTKIFHTKEETSGSYGPDYPKSRKRRELPSAEETQRAVDKHNEFRGIIGDEGEEPIPSNMMYMTWDPSLAINALRYAKKCIWEHSQDHERATTHFPGWNGENLWAGHGHFTDDFDPTVGMTSWYNEYKDYDFYSHNCTPKKLCGHYTQVVWFDSYKLGCAWTICSSFDTLAGEIWTDAAYTVCHYAPGGNDDTMNLYKVGPRCSECHPNDTCPDGRLCRNEERDRLLPAPSDAGAVIGIVCSLLAILVLFAAGAYYIYTHKNHLFAAWRKRRKISDNEEMKPNGREQNNNAQSRPTEPNALKQ